MIWHYCVQGYIPQVLENLRNKLNLIVISKGDGSSDPCEFLFEILEVLEHF